MKFYRSYDGTQQTYRIDHQTFQRPFNYLSPGFEKLLKSQYVKNPKYIPEVKRLNIPEIAGYTPLIKNY